MATDSEFQRQAEALAAAGRLTALKAIFEVKIAPLEAALVRNDYKVIRPLVELHHQLAKILLKHGQVDAAQIAAERGQVIILKYLNRLPANITQKFACMLDEVGFGLYEQGHLSKAVTAYNSAIELLEKPQTRLKPDKLILLRNDLAGIYKHRGSARLIQGQLEASIMDCTRAIRLEECMMAMLEPQHKWIPQLRDNLAGCYINRGIARDIQEQSEEAIADHTQAIRLREGIRAMPKLQEEPISQLCKGLAIAYTNRGTAQLNLGKLDAAMTDYTLSIRLMDGIPEKKRTPQLLNNLAETYTNLGNAHLYQGQSEETIAYCTEAIRLREGIRAMLETPKKWTPHLRNDLARVYMNRGTAYLQQGESEAAIADYTQAIGLEEGIRAMLELQEWTPPLRNYLAGGYMNLGNARHKLGQSETAVEDNIQAIDIIETIPLGLLPETDQICFQCYSNAIEVRKYHIGQHGFARDKSRRMADVLELTIQTKDAWDYRNKLRKLFADFHARWLEYCVSSGDIEVITEILAAIQGRELAAEVADRLSLDKSDTPDAVRKFQELRMELRKLSTSIQGSIQNEKAGTWIDGGTSFGGRMSITAATFRPLPTNYQELLQQYEALLKQTREQRTLATKERGYEYLNPSRTITTAALQGILAEDEAILLAIDGKEPLSGLMLICHAKPPRWLEVPGIAAKADSVRNFSKYLGSKRGYRRGPEAITTLNTTSELELDLPTFWEDQANWQAEHIWAPLAIELAKVRRLICITHGRLHLLPMEAGAPEHLTLGRFPGLVFFAEQRGLFCNRPSPIPAQIRLTVDVYQGDNNPIPQVDTEAAALKSLYPPEAIVYPGEFPTRQQQAHLVHLACHGGNDPQRNDGTAALNIRPNVYLGQDTLLDSHTSIQNVYINACVAAWTVEDLNGTPSGLVSALFRLGASQVVGALVSIPDYWAFVLAVLTHQSLLQDVTLDQALREGKKRLASGEWGPPRVKKLLLELQTKQLHTLWDALVCEFGKTWAKREFKKEVPKILTDLNLDASAKENALLQLKNTESIEIWIEAVVEKAMAINRIPPQPDLGTLLYGMITFGEITT